MDAHDTVQPPAQIFYWCLPSPERNCRCTLADLLEGRDCGVVVKPPRERRER